MLDDLGNPHFWKPPYINTRGINTSQCGLEPGTLARIGSSQRQRLNEERPGQSQQVQICLANAAEISSRIGSSQRQRLKEERLGPPRAFLLFLFCPF